MAQSRPHRVLIVEDHDDAREMYVLTVEYAGMDAQSAADSETAFRVAVDWQPDLVVTDFLLRGGENGARLCHRLRQDPRTCDIPTVVMTGSTRRDDVEAILGAGCADIRIKPYSPDALIADVRRLTGRASARRTA
jgi:two-component system phosphate regulon response regulator PhoB